MFNWLSKSTENPMKMQMYKKPTDFTRDPGNLKNLGKEILKIAFELVE